MGCKAKVDNFMNNSLLQTRLRSCLQTIIDLEPSIAQTEIGAKMLVEFEILKKFLKDMDKLSLTEADVERVENSTNVFLQELSMPVSAPVKAETYLETETKKLH